MLEVFAGFGVAIIVVAVVLSVWGICCAIFDDPDEVTLTFFIALLLILSIVIGVTTVNHVKTVENTIEIEEKE